MDPAHVPPELLKQNKGPLLVAIVWVFAALALIVVSIKVWTRVKVLHQSDLENVFHSVFVLLAWVLSLVYGALLTASVHSGLGKHAFALDRQAIDTAIMLYSVSVPFGTLSVALPALAIAIVLKKITDPSYRQLWLLYGIPALNIVIKVINVILIFSTCSPASLVAGKRTSKCVKLSVVTGYIYFSTCFSAATAVFLAMWPMVAFWKLQLKPKTKLSLILLFSTTAVAAVCALARVGYLPRLGQLQDFTLWKATSSSSPPASPDSAPSSSTSATDSTNARNPINPPRKPTALIPPQRPSPRHLRSAEWNPGLRARSFSPHRRAAKHTNRTASTASNPPQRKRTWKNARLSNGARGKMRSGRARTTTTRTTRWSISWAKWCGVMMWMRKRGG
ncbi:MAG: hypothetical protein Q9223_005415 [Gallowayella weberi]